MGDKPSVELIEVGSRQLKEAKKPPATVEKEGKTRFVKTYEYFGVLTKAWKNEALTWEEVKAFLSQAEDQIGTIDNIPSRFTFNMQEGEGGAKSRQESLNEILTELGVSSIKEGGEDFSPSEIWDAVYYQAAENKEKYPYLKSERGKKIIKASEKICQKVDRQQQKVIKVFEDGLLAEDIDPRSLTHDKLLAPVAEDIDLRSLTHDKLLARDGINSVRLNKRQKENKIGKIQVKNTLLLRAKLDRYDVITAFLNQRAEGRGGEKEAPALGDSQLPAMISYKEGEKTMKVQGLSDDEVRDLFKILEEVDVFKEKHKQELLPGRGFQGRKGWIAEAALRRMHEVWKETTDIFQKDTSGLLTWVSELGHGCMVSEWLSIPGVAEVLTWPELYQQRDPVTDKPKRIESLEEIEAILKQRAINLDIPTSKVDLAIFLSQMLQLGYWTGRVGWKTRHPGEKYGFLDINAGLPIWSWENFVDKADLTPEQKAVFTPERRKVFEFQLAELNAFVVGMAMTGYTVEHLGRIPDEASQEDLLFLNEVGEPPIYAMPDDAIIRVIADLDMIPFEKMKQNFQYSFLHREQYRWQFVYAYYNKDKEGKGLLPKFSSPIGEEAVEKQYFNPWSVTVEGNDGKSKELRKQFEEEAKERRKVLIDYLQKQESPAVVTLNEAGLNPNLITDEVIQALFTDQNMLAVNQNRRDFYDQQHREITLADLANFSASARTVGEIAMVLELVLRDKRTWGLDMGTNNSLFNSPELPIQIRKRGGFSADQAGLMVTVEYNRKNHMETLSQYLEVMARAHLRNEYYNAKDIVEKLSMKYGDLPRVRANSLVNPWTILETAASIRATMMLIGYWDAGYAHTGGRMVSDQEALYDQSDIDRLFHERFYPVIGAAQRVKKGHEGYINWMKDICLKQRAKLSASLARFYERQFYSQMAPLNGIIEIQRGEGGKHIYSHCVPVYRDGKEDFVMPDQEKYFEAMTERFAEMFYWPASRNQLESMNSQAKQKQLDEDHARQQIDQLVGLGFMRRWKNDKGELVGLGDKFKVQFKIGKQNHVYPIEFMMNLGQNVRSVAADYATAKGFEIPGYTPEISARYFWEIVKNGTLEKTIEGLEKTIKDVAKGTDEYKEVEKRLEEARKNKGIWKDFCKMMIEGWLVDPSMPDSMMPQFYWEWRETTQKALGIPEEGVYGLGEKMRLAYEGGKDVVMGQMGPAIDWLHKKGLYEKGPSAWMETLSQPGVRAELETKWLDDPIPGALKEIKKNFCKKIVFDFVTQLKNGEKDGWFLREKVDLRHQIEGAFRADHIDRHTYEELMNLVVNTSYRPNFWKNIKNSDYLVHKKYWSIYGLAFDGIIKLLGNFGAENIKNNLNVQTISLWLHSSPIGYGISLVSMIGVPFIVVPAATALATASGTVAVSVAAVGLAKAVGGIIFGGQGVAVGGAAIVRGIDLIVRKINKGKKGLFGSSADPLIFEAEYTGTK